MDDTNWTPELMTDEQKEIVANLMRTAADVTWPEDGWETDESVTEIPPLPPSTAFTCDAFTRYALSKWAEAHIDPILHLIPHEDDSVYPCSKF